ncbi:MAG: hypothetical protein ACREQA_06685 [Candidatus Binatia bacterium]
MKLLVSLLHDRVARRLGVWSGIAYVLLSLYAVGNIVIAPGVDLAAGGPVPSADVVSDWTAKIWKPVAPFVWEPIAAVFLLRSVALFFSVPNFLLALSLGILVGLNLSVAVARARLMSGGASKGGSLRPLLASVPALLTGFTCCVPTVILALGSLAVGFAVAAVAVAPYFLPIAAILLVVNLVWGLRQFACALHRVPARLTD